MFANRGLASCQQLSSREDAETKKRYSAEEWSHAIVASFYLHHIHELRGGMQISQNLGYGVTSFRHRSYTRRTGEKTTLGDDVCKFSLQIQDLVEIVHGGSYNAYDGHVEYGLLHTQNRRASTRHVIIMAPDHRINGESKRRLDIHCINGTLVGSSYEKFEDQNNWDDGKHLQNYFDDLEDSSDGSILLNSNFVWPHLSFTGQTPGGPTRPTPVIPFKSPINGGKRVRPHRVENRSNKKSKNEE
jgi:hypothetical protein